MKRLLLGVFILLSLNGCNSKPCDNLPNSFSSYSQAVESVEGSSFKFTDKLSSGKSSWISTANYYSCDGNSGYMIYTTKDGRQYIHDGVPKSEWLAFKTAPSSGSYYVKNIKGRYRLLLE